MRDPLAWIPIRYKLPLTFVFFCLLAFGLGGYVVTTTARDSLRQQIELRLDENAGSLGDAVDHSLDLLGRRVQDFASDGFIRQQFEQLIGGENDIAAREDLIRHLRENKLTLVGEFTDAALLDRRGATILTAHGDWEAPAGFDRDRLWLGPLADRMPGFPFPTFVLSTPLAAIRGDERLGYLQIVVRADRWAETLEADLAFPGALDFAAHVGMPGGFSLPLVAGGANPVADDEWILFEKPMARGGWRLDLAVDADALTIPVDALLRKFVYLGLALLALTLSMLLFPQQFLLKPLSALQDAARRIAEGDFSARVDYSSRDEVGELAGAFNMMATAVEERTRKLQQAAAVLKRREADIRFERDRLNAVIRSMEDGLFILDASGRITLSNVAARPVIRAMSRSRSTAIPEACGAGASGVGNCLECVADFNRDVQGCVVAVGDRVFEINGAVLSGPREAIAGKVFVSRDVTARMRRAEREAHQERLSVLGEIAAVMAHELNNPLAAISMFSQMLMKGLDTGSQPHGHAEVIHRNTESCKATIRSLLDMATTSTAEYDEFDVHQLLADVSQLLTPVAQRSTVEVRLGDRTADGRAFGDELQIRQALVNLVMNAIQALAEEQDGVVILETHDRGGEVAVAVRDNGPGIARKVHERIFEPFFTTKAPGDGTGLGLPTSRRIVEAQGGRLTLLETRPGRTVFEIVLPRDRVVPDARAYRAQVVPRHAGRMS